MTLVYIPKHDDTTGASCTGATGETERTFTLTNLNAVADQMQISIGSGYIQQTRDYTFASQIVTFHVNVFDADVIRIDYNTELYVNTTYIPGLSGINNWDKNIRGAFDKMTASLGSTATIYPKATVQTRFGFEGATSSFGTGVIEAVSLQEADSQHAMVLSGQLNIGDVQVTFLSNSVIQEEDEIFVNSKYYKIIKVSRFMGMNSNVVTDIRAFGKLLPKR